MSLAATLLKAKTRRTSNCCVVLLHLLLQHLPTLSATVPCFTCPPTPCTGSKPLRYTDHASGSGLQSISPSPVLTLVPPFPTGAKNVGSNQTPTPPTYRSFKDCYRASLLYTFCLLERYDPLCAPQQGWLNLLSGVLPHKSYNH